MAQNEMLPQLVGAVLAVAVFCTLFVEGGWLLWFPVLLALHVVYHIGRAPGR
jgi:hypothetical protein